MFHPGIHSVSVRSHFGSSLCCLSSYCVVGRMAAVLDPVEVACRLLRAVVEAGASRHVTSASSCALWRANFAPDRISDDIKPEVDARLKAIRPVISEKVSAAIAGRVLKLSGGVRAKWNVAEHALFGAGPEVVKCADVAIKLMQRGSRRGKSKRGKVAVSDSLTDMPSTQSERTSSAEPCDGHLLECGDLPSRPLLFRCSGCPLDLPQLPSCRIRGSTNSRNPRTWVPGCRSSQCRFFPGAWTALRRSSRPATAARRPPAICLRGS